MTYANSCGSRLMVIIGPSYPVFEIAMFEQKGLDCLVSILDPGVGYV